MKTLLLFLAMLVSVFSVAQDGGMDTSFGNEGVVITDIDDSTDLGLAVVQQDDGKLVISGITSSDNGNSFLPYVVRYLPDGSLDNSFGDGGTLIGDFAEGYTHAMNVFIDELQNIIVAGIFIESQAYHYKVARYDANGFLDTSFGTNGLFTVPSGYESKMTMLSDDSFLFVKFKNNDEISVFHYLENGTLNLDFGVNGIATSAFTGGQFKLEGVKADANGNIFVLGRRDITLAADIILMQFQPDGYLNTSFGNNGMAIKTIDAMNPMNSSSAGFDFTDDGKIVIAGSSGACLNESHSIRQPFFLKYESDGLPDNSFGVNGTVLLPISNFEISQLLIQTNQKMMAVGHAQDCFEGSSYIIRRYYLDGNIDYSFSGGAPMELEYSTSIFQNDGKIVSIGSTPWYTGNEDIVVFRLNNNPLSVPQFEDQVVKVYPNPSKGIFTVEREFPLANNSYQITDVVGKIIANGELYNQQTQIDLSSFQSGMYFLKTGNEVIRLLRN